mmetsp:Transcript_39063/g.129307  ORF Transcript_39063/g.129307 Transcript_39063/m.129307 type:complete len:407 (+) Transcript_39063:126-1346(+)
MERPLPPSVDVGVFWDFENVRIPKGFDPMCAGKMICDAVIQYGRIVEQRLYFDSRKPSEMGTDRLNLDHSGFTLVDCPARGTKEAIDKKLIVDLMAFAHQRDRNNVKCVAVLITSDGDYCYAVSRVRQLGVGTVVIFGSEAHTAGALISNSDVALSWRFDVLHESEADVSEPEINEVLQEPNVDSIENASPPPDDESPGEAPTDADLVSSSINDALDGRHLLLCNELRRLQRGANWVQDQYVARRVHQKRGAQPPLSDSQRAYYRESRDSAVRGRFVEAGRRHLATGSIQSVVSISTSTPIAEGFSKSEIYLRLTRQGLEQLQNPSEASQMVLRESFAGMRLNVPEESNSGSASATPAARPRPSLNLPLPRVLCRDWNGTPGSCTYESMTGRQCRFFHFRSAEVET